MQDQAINSQDSMTQLNTTEHAAGAQLKTLLASSPH